jgi:membrane-associated phospholipid phosphatase
MVLISNLFNVPMFLIGRLKPPFRDDTLAALDSWFGLEVPQILALQSSFPTAYDFVSACYPLLLPLIIAALTLPTAFGDGRCVREFFIALIVSGIIGFTLFYLLPAAGWFERYNITPRPDQVLYLEMIRNTWGQETFEIDLSYRAGLVYFPSFHTILPILSLFALRSFPRVVTCTIPLAVLIVLSTMTTGSHYPCDIYAGVVVALVSWWIASKVEPHLSGQI